MASECNACKKSEPDVHLKRCAKCSTTQYCSRDCQKDDWKTHKKICGKQAGARSTDNDASSPSGSRLSPPKGLEQAITNPFTKLDNETWLHNRPEEDVYRLLLDVYRLRIEDDYKLTGDVDEDSVYAGHPDSLAGFRLFLDKIEARASLLPSWWTPEKRTACETLGMDASQWQDLRHAVQKSDIISHYGDQRFPMELRMFGESVIGTGPGGSPGETMRKMMVQMESGGTNLTGSIIDSQTLNSLSL